MVRQLIYCILVITVICAIPKSTASAADSITDWEARTGKQLGSSTAPAGTSTSAPATTQPGIRLNELTPYTVVPLIGEFGDEINETMFGGALDAANKLLGRIYVWGQVRNQGPIDIAVNENLTASKAILRAGGFADFANKKKVKVVRPDNVKGSGKQSFELNMDEIFEKGKTEKDVILQPDDFIIVPSRLINF